jgi:hypothetical protein
MSILYDFLLKRRYITISPFCVKYTDWIRIFTITYLYFHYSQEIGKEKMFIKIEFLNELQKLTSNPPPKNISKVAD